MKIGDLVMPTKYDIDERRRLGVPLVEEDWKGIIIGWKGSEPIVFWDERFPAEVEYKEQLEVISESR